MLVFFREEKWQYQKENIVNKEHEYKETLDIKEALLTLLSVRNVMLINYLTEYVLNVVVKSKKIATLQ
jgi:hypothetical protein